MINIFIILIISIMLLAVAYLFIHFKNFSWIRCFTHPKWLPNLLSIALIIICMILTYSVSAVTIIVIIYLIYGFVICDILHLILRKVLKSDALKKKWSQLYRSGILAFLITICLLFLSYYKAIHVQFKEYSLQTEKILEGDKLTIAMISDLHLGTTMDAKKLEEYCTQINEKNPDIILLLGDIFDESTDKESMELACQAFGTLSSTYGTYYVFGNHDVNSYRPLVSLEKSDITDNLIKNNIIILDDEVRMINNNFYLIGRSDKSFFKNSKRKTISQLIEPLDTNKYMILLDHQPVELKTAASLGIDLQLSGHTHSGQIWPIGLIAKIFNINELNYGNKKAENYNAIVTSGIGCWGYPLRLGSNSEIVIIQITNSK